MAANFEREKRARIAQNTLDILRTGVYVNHRGREIDIQSDIDYCISNSQLYTPDMLKENWSLSDGNSIDCLVKNTNIEVRNESTLHAARRLISEGSPNPVCLNFASARNPGGGFLKGSEAQEESLARSSALYPCIEQMQTMYEVNHRDQTGLYTDYMIYSPKVPVFRDDSGQLLENPLLVSFISAPAVNAGRVRGDNIHQIVSVMLRRIAKILNLALINQHDDIVLGAYGCGVFGNDPSDVAGYFARHLLEGGEFHNAFNRVVFAVLDRSQDKANLKAFQGKFN